MLQYIITVMVAASMLVATAATLEDIAYASADKTILAAERMHNAMDCAFAGLPLELCEPQLHDVSVKNELEQFDRLLSEEIQAARNK